MDILLLSIGKTSSKFIENGIEDFFLRLKHYISFKIEYLPDIRNTKKLTELQQKEAEGKLILNFLNSSDYVVLLDERGKEYTSKEFASWMEKIMASGFKRIIFIIGGPYGFSPSVYERANTKMALSKMTFTHEMCRLFFTEQLYRAFTIIKGEPYHHN